MSKMQPQVHPETTFWGFMGGFLGYGRVYGRVRWAWGPLSDLSWEAYYENPRVFIIPGGGWLGVCVCASPCCWFDQFTLLIWPKGQNRKHLTISRCWFDQKVKTESIWPVHVVDLTKRSKREGIRWPLWVGKLRRKCKAPPPKNGIWGSPKTT